MPKKAENTSHAFIRYVTLLFWYLRKKKSISRRQAVDYSLAQGQGQILSVLMEDSEMPQKKLVAQLDMRPQSASEMIKKLQRKQLILRRINPHDKRSFTVSLTQKGRDTMEESLGQQEFVPGIMTTLTSAEKDEFARLVAKLQMELDEKVSHEDERMKEQYNRVGGK